MKGSVIYKLKRELIALFLISPLCVYAQDPNWIVNPSAYEHSMSLTAVITDAEGLFASDEANRIGVFDGEDCVGEGYTSTYFPPLDANLAFVLVYGNSASATYNLKVYIGGEVYEAGVLNFISNGVQGTLDEPYQIHPVYSLSGCTDSLAVNYNSSAFTVHINEIVEDDIEKSGTQVVIVLPGDLEQHLND